MEDMCQLCERLTEDKYNSSHEHIAKTIQAFSAQPLLDIVLYYEVVLFSFLIGNNDMHLKNFSLFAPDGMNYDLTPAYDLLSSQLLLPSDKEELALSLNGKKRRLKRSDLTKAMTVHLTVKAVEKLFDRILGSTATWIEFIAQSPLNKELQDNLIEIIQTRTAQLQR